MFYYFILWYVPVFVSFVSFKINLTMYLKSLYHVQVILSLNVIFRSAEFSVIFCDAEFSVIFRGALPHYLLISRRVNNICPLSPLPGSSRGSRFDI